MSPLAWLEDMGLLLLRLVVFLGFLFATQGSGRYAVDHSGATECA